VPLPSSLVATATAPVVHLVDARWRMAYAAGIGNTAPAYLDSRLGRDAHPLFPVCVEWPAVLAAGTLLPPQVLSREERVRGVHASHDLTVHRLVTEGDELTTIATIESIERRRPGAYQVLRLETVDDEGQPVATTRMGSLFLGVEVDGEDASTRPSTGAPDEVTTFPTIGGAGIATIHRAIPVNAAHIYTECSRIYNPIHTDPRVAEAAGLPGPILHGTATLAMAIDEVVNRVAMGDPSLVRRVSCRFGAMVAMPSTIAIRVLQRVTMPGAGDRYAVSFEVLNDDGAAAIREGVVHLGQTPMAG
jgi:acyl dehydratase